MHTLVLIRHGQSVWNLENRFTGWTDVDLSDQGIAEAEEGARLLKAEGFTFDRCHTSYLRRAIRTLWTVLERMDLMWLPVETTWRLNERHYGALQGLNKAETLTAQDAVNAITTTASASPRLLWGYPSATPTDIGGNRFPTNVDSITIS